MGRMIEKMDSGKDFSRKEDNSKLKTTVDHLMKLSWSINWISVRLKRSSTFKVRIWSSLEKYRSNNRNNQFIL